MTRLEKLPPARLDDAQQELYQQITGGPRATGPFPLVDADGALEGPFNAMLRSPSLGTALQGLGAAVRYRSALPARARELAILVVSAHWDCAFERYAHEATGRQVGLTEDVLRALRTGGTPVLAHAHEDAVVVTTRALVSAGDLDDRQYADAIAALGEAGLFELTTLVGYYATLALQLRVFRVEAPHPS
jgi:4-carboxymuconolactone decarboxylase